MVVSATSSVNSVDIFSHTLRAAYRYIKKRVKNTKENSVGTIHCSFVTLALATTYKVTVIIFIKQEN